MCVLHRLAESWGHADAKNENSHRWGGCDDDAGKRKASQNDQW